MPYRIVVGGYRDFTDYAVAKEYIDFCIQTIREREEIIILSGTCRGADLLGERYAEENGFKVERYPADWDKYGKYAGPMRNRQMMDAADAVIAFWDGKSKGTKSLIEYAKEQHKPIRIKRI